MTERQQDVFNRAFKNLLSLRNNINQMTDKRISESYVREFHVVLERLESIGIDVSEFSIPESHITPRVTAVRTLTFKNQPSGPKLSKEKYVEKTYILIKLDAILGYFEIITSEKPKRMGFTK